MIELNKLLNSEKIYDKLDYKFRMNYYFRRYKTYTRGKHIFVWKEIKSDNMPLKKNYKTITKLIQNREITDRYSSKFYTLIK